MARARRRSRAKRSAKIGVKVVMRSLREEPVEAVGEEPFDGLGSEDAGELVLQLGADGEQQVALGEGELVGGGHQPPAFGLGFG